MMPAYDSPILGNEGCVVQIQGLVKLWAPMSVALILLLLWLPNAHASASARFQVQGEIAYAFTFTQRGQEPVNQRARFTVAVDGCRWLI